MRETATFARKIRKTVALLAAVCMIAVLSAAACPPVTAHASSSNEKEIYEYLTQELDYSTAAACGIMANIWCESSFKPTAYNSAGGSYGLCQWLGGRLSNLRSFCKEHGYDASSIKGQLEFLNHELEGGYSDTGDYLRNVDNTKDGAYDAASYWCIHFEKPSNKNAKAQQRGKLATGTYWEKYKGDAIDQWIEKDGKTYYRFKTGDYQKGWFTLDGATYYFDEDGVLQTGITEVDGKRYYFADDGKQKKGWQSVDGAKYYFDGDGKMVTGWQKLDGETYYFDSDGKMVTGWQTIDDTQYYFDGDGRMQPVTIEVNGQKYFVDESGDIQTDNTINSKIDDASESGSTASGSDERTASKSDAEADENAGTEAAAQQEPDD